MIRLRRLFILAILLAGALAAAAETYSGNTKSRVFHQSSCRYHACKNCTASFGSSSEAVKRGYRACGVCRPGGSGEQHSEAVEEGYSGNTNSRKFHRASCRYASCGNCTAKFESRQQAIDAGYVPGGCCKP